eukprot:m.335279 g.335279  ORF g.335279 m.335279 type:complete len:295 (+) comp17559_c0_seq1:215-1099(+)
MEENKDIQWHQPGPHCNLTTWDEFLKGSDDMTNTMLQPDPSVFQIRGKTYLSDKRKVDATGPAFEFLDLKVFAHTENILHTARRIKSLKLFLESHSDREFVIINRMLPLTPILNVIEIFHRKKGVKNDSQFESLFERYKTEGDKFRNLRLKFLVKIPNASWVVKTAVGALGGFRPVIMGKGYLQQEHFLGSNYYEVDVDIGTSRIARGVTGVILPQNKKLIIDEGFVLEGQDESELPEILLACARGVRIDLYSLGVKVTPDILNPVEDAEKPTDSTKQERSYSSEDDFSDARDS